MPKPGYRWSEAARRYVEIRSGQAVAPGAVRAALEEVSAAYQADMARVTQRLLAGQIALAEWQGEMAALIKGGHLTAAALMRGGWGQMSQADWGFAGQLIKRQYGFLNRLAKQVERGEQKLNGRLLRRAVMYGEALRGTGESANRRLHQSQGFGEERRVRGVADSCPTCVSEAAKGWQPIGTLKAIGDSECLTRCRCHFEYRQPAEAALLVAGLFLERYGVSVDVSPGYSLPAAEADEADEILARLPLAATLHNNRFTELALADVPYQLDPKAYGVHYGQRIIIFPPGRQLRPEGGAGVSAFEETLLHEVGESVYKGLSQAARAEWAELVKRSQLQPDKLKEELNEAFAVTFSQVWSGESSGSPELKRWVKAHSEAGR